MKSGWKCEKCGTVQESQTEETILEYIDESGHYKKGRVCPDCVREYQMNVTDEYLEKLSELRAKNEEEFDDASFVKRCIKCGELVSEECEACPYCGGEVFREPEDATKTLPLDPQDHIPGLLARCEKHLRIIKGILIAEMLFSIIGGLIIVFLIFGR